MMTITALHAKLTSDISRWIFVEVELGSGNRLHYSHLCPPDQRKSRHCLADEHGLVECSATNQERKHCHGTKEECYHTPTCFGCPPQAAAAPVPAPAKELEDDEDDSDLPTDHWTVERTVGQCLNSSTTTCSRYQRKTYKYQTFPHC